jgi:AcrR family transcriptional regulator
MGEIAPKARVPKGTLYVYFDSKERLFEAIAHEECGVQTEAVFSLDPADHDVESVLTRVGCSFVKFMRCPGAMSPLRTVIAISDRMPEIGSVNTRATLTPPLKPLTPMISLEKVRIAEGSRFARNVTPSRKRIHMHDQ